MAENGKHIEFVKTLQNEFQCGICKLLLCSPFQCACGQRYCENCIKDFIRSSKMCPECETVLEWENIFPDKFCERQIAELETCCPNKHHRCKWTGPFKLCKEHFSECPRRLLACPNEGCQAVVLRSEMENHSTNTCQFANTSCPMAGQCDFQGSRGELGRHLEKKNAEHMFMVKHEVSAIQFEIERVKNTTTTVQEQHQVLKEKHQVLEEKNQVLEEKNQALEEKNQVLEEKIKNQEEEVRTLRNDLANLHVLLGHMHPES